MQRHQGYVSFVCLFLTIYHLSEKTTESIMKTTNFKGFQATHFLI